MRKTFISLLSAAIVVAGSVATAAHASAADPALTKCEIKMTTVPAGFPTCANTGVPTCAGQTVYHGDLVFNKDSKSLKVTNQTRYGSITADGVRVLIYKSRIRDGGNLKLNTKNGGSIYIENSEIDGMNGDGEVAVGYGNISMYRVWIHGMVDGVRLSSNVTVKDSLITDNHSDRAKKYHPDSSQTTGGTDITIQHSSLLAFRTAEGTQANSGVEIGSETADVNKLTVTNSYIDGGNYGILMQTPNSKGSEHAISNVSITNNVFGGHHRYGAMALPQATKVPGLTVTGNKMTDGTDAKIHRW